MSADRSVYDIESAQLPYLYGVGLKIFVRALRWPVLGRLLVDNLLGTAGIKAFRKKPVRRRANTDADPLCGESGAGICLAQI